MRVLLRFIFHYCLLLPPALLGSEKLKCVQGTGLSEVPGAFLVAAYCVVDVVLCLYIFALSDTAVYLLLLNHCNTYIHTSDQSTLPNHFVGIV